MSNNLSRLNEIEEKAVERFIEYRKNTRNMFAFTAFQRENNLEAISEVLFEDVDEVIDLLDGDFEKFTEFLTIVFTNKRIKK